MSDDRLHVLEITVASNTATVQQYLKSAEARDALQEDINKKLFQMIAETHGVIHGKDEAPGIKGRVDRIEQRNRLVGWAAGIATAAWVSQLVKWASEHWK